MYHPNVFKKLIVLWLIILSCVPLTMAQISKLQTEPYTFVSNSGEKIEAELCAFQVAENRTKTDSRAITIRFVRFKSTNPNPGNPIIYLAGGPGGSGIETAKGKRFELFMALRQAADVIALDQRGTGLSNDIPQCDQKADFPLNEPGEESVYIQKINTTAKHCLEYWQSKGYDITGYNTIENAQDLDDLRKVLGVEKINLWGISYGTHLAFAYIKKFDAHLDKVVLASLEGPDHTIKLPSENQQFLEYLNKKIQEDTKAAQVYPDLLKLMQEVFDKLEKTPVTAKFTDQRTQKEKTVSISKFDLQLVTSFFLLKNPEDSKNLPYLFTQMKQGDFSGIAPLAVMVKQYAGYIQAMPLAMDAMSGISDSQWKKVQKEAQTALLGRTTNFPFPDVSQNLGLPDLGDEFRKNPRSNVKALFFSGTLDGRTYVPSARELVKGFKNGIHIIIDGAGHDLFMCAPQVQSFMLDFFQNKSVKSQTIQIKMPEFTITE